MNAPSLQDLPDDGDDTVEANSPSPSTPVAVVVGAALLGLALVLASLWVG